MIKEWCEKCDGRKGIYVQDDKYPTLAKLINCHNCQGKGYTELEPEWEGMVCDMNAFRYLSNGKNETEIIYTTRPSCVSSNANQKNVEVYIKEVKE